MPVSTLLFAARISYGIVLLGRMWDFAAHVACSLVCQLDMLCKKAELIVSRFGADSCGPRELCIRWGSRSSTGKGTFE